MVGVAVGAIVGTLVGVGFGVGAGALVGMAVGACVGFVVGCGVGFGVEITDVAIVLFALVAVGGTELAWLLVFGSAFPIAPQIPQATNRKRMAPQPIPHWKRARRARKRLQRLGRCGKGYG